jgi:hypothetical protein
MASARRPGPLLLAMSLTDRSPARAEGDRSVGLGSHRPPEPRVTAPPRQRRCLRHGVLAATMGLRLRVTAATAPGWRPSSARWNRSRLEGPLARSEGDRSLGHCSPGPLEPASLRTRPRRNHGVASSTQNVSRPEGPFFAAGQYLPRSIRCQDRVLAAARRSGNEAFRSPSPRIIRSYPDLLASAVAPSAEARAWVGIGS